MDVSNLGHHCKTIKPFEHSFVGYSFFIVASNRSVPLHTLELRQNPLLNRDKEKNESL